VTTVAVDIIDGIGWYKSGGLFIPDVIGAWAHAPSGWAFGTSLNMTGITMDMNALPSAPGSGWAHTGGAISFAYESTGGTWSGDYGGWSNSWPGTEHTVNMGTHTVGHRIRCRTSSISSVSPMVTGYTETI